MNHSELIQASKAVYEATEYNLGAVEEVAISSVEKQSTGVVVFGAVVWWNQKGFNTHSFKIESGKVSFFWGHYDMDRARAFESFNEKIGA